MRKNYILLIVLGVCWVALVILIFKVAGKKKEEKVSYEDSRVYSVDKDTSIGIQKGLKKEEPKIPKEVIQQQESIKIEDTSLLTLPSSLTIATESVSVSEQETVKDKGSKEPQEVKKGEIPSRSAIIKDNIEFLRSGSKSAYQVRLRAHSYRVTAKNYREQADKLSGAPIEQIRELRSMADFFDSIASRLERTQGLKSRMRRLANELESALPYVGGEDDQ